MAAKVQFSAEFAADTSTAEANLKRYNEAIAAANKTLAQAERTAKQSYGEQMAQAKAVGASTEQLGRITQQYNQKLYSIGITAKQVGQSLVDANRGALTSEEAKAKAIDLTNKELAAQIVVVNELAAANAHQSHEAVSGVHATSAAIRGIEGSRGIRAIENFISKTLGLGPAMAAIFPIVGGLMFGKMLIDTGMKFYEVEQKAAHAAETINAAFDEQHTKARINIDDLTVQADKLQDNIDKISGHPGNGLQTSLDEARRYADKLMESLKGDNKELQALFKENSVGTFGSLLSGVASTAAQEKQLLADRVGLTKQFQQINSEYNKELGNAKSTDEVKALGVRRDAAVRAATQSTIDTYRREQTRLQAQQSTSDREAAVAANTGHAALTPINNNAKVANISGDAGQLQDLLNQQAAQQRVSDLTEKEGAAKQQKEADEAAKRAASAARKGSNEALAAARKAAEEQRKQWDDEHAEFQSAGDRTAADEVTFWVARANAADAGSENYLQANKHIDENLKKENQEKRRLFNEALKMAEEFNAIGTKHLTSVLSSGVNSDAKGFADQQTSLKALIDAQRESTYQQALAQAQQDASLGTISKYDEQVRIQTLHTAEYAAQLAELKAQLAAVDGADSEATAKRNVIQKQITDTQSRSQLDSMRDTANTAAQTWQGALTNANALWVQDSMDSAKQVKELYSSVLGGLNTSLVSLITGGNGNFAQMFKGIGGQLANVGLQKIEGGLLGKFGMGKADGSKANPLHVMVENGIGSATSSVLSAIPNGGAGGVLSTMLGLVPGFGGFRAGGGSVSAGRSYVVGEHGPELATFGSAAHITSNRDMSSMRNGGGDIHIHVDATGSSDPAQVRYQARLGAMEGHAAASRVQGDHQAEQRRRQPSSRM